MKAWAQANLNHPLHPACDQEADWQIDLRKKGFTADMITVLPAQVAAACEALLNDKDPDPFVLVIEWKFRILYWLAIYLPTYWADRFTIAL
jgi:hypothetical protein